MNIKRIAITLAAAGALLASAMPALGYSRHSGNTDVTIVSNGSGAYANTGGNTQNNTAVFGGDITQNGGSRTMTTGNADADSTAVVVADTNIGCGCESRRGHHQSSTTDFTMVENGSEAVADSGNNEQDNTAVGHWSDVRGNRGSRTMTTGNASADSDAWVIADTNVSGWEWSM